MSLMYDSLKQHERKVRRVAVEPTNPDNAKRGADKYFFQSNVFKYLVIGGGSWALIVFMLLPVERAVSITAHDESADIVEASSAGNQAQPLVGAERLATNVKDKAQSLDAKSPPIEEGSRSSEMSEILAVDQVSNDQLTSQRVALASAEKGLIKAESPPVLIDESIVIEPQPQTVPEQVAVAVNHKPDLAVIKPIKKVTKETSKVAISYSVNPVTSQKVSPPEIVTTRKTVIAPVSISKSKPILKSTQNKPVDKRAEKPLVDRTSRAYFAQVKRLVTGIKQSVLLNNNERVRQQLLDLSDLSGPDSVIFYRMNGYSLLKQKSYQEAAQSYMNLLRQVSDDLEANMNLALIEAKLGQYPESLARLNRMLALNPGSRPLQQFKDQIRAKYGH